MSSARPLFVCLLFITACSSAAATTGSSASTSPERLPVVDGSTGVTYWIKSHFASGDIYTQSPNDSGIDNFVAVINPATGFSTPIAIGFLKATGMVFVPN